jgi:hypothetical protein
MTRAFRRKRRESRFPMRRVLMGATALCLVLIAATAAYATSAGDLDPSFGHHGLRIVGNTNEASGAVAVGKKGRIVISGGRTVARLRSNGRLDHSFANGGIANIGTPPRIYEGGYTSLALGRHGDIFAGAETCNTDESRCGFAVPAANRR